MYQGFYNLKDLPFRLTADPAYLYMTSRHREALSGLVYSICTRPGLTVLVGEAGTGKSTLLRALIDLLERKQHPRAYFNNPMLTREEFYDLLLYKLGVECASPLKGRQLIALQDTLMRYRASGRPAVLIVDEAQRLPLDLLEEIRLLLNLETPQEKLLEIILAGQPELTEILDRPQLRQFKQRVSAICRLQPLELDELREYMQHRLAQAGLPNQKIFPPQTVDLIYEYTMGIPRLVNALCDTALQCGFGLQSLEITPAILMEAAGDLDLRTDAGRAAVPVSTPSPGTEAAKVIPMPSANTDTQPTAKTVHSEPNGSDTRMPLESYSSRQKSFTFLGHLLERWR